MSDRINFTLPVNIVPVCNENGNGDIYERDINFRLVQIKRIIGDLSSRDTGDERIVLIRQKVKLSLFFSSPPPFSRNESLQRESIQNQENFIRNENFFKLLHQHTYDYFYKWINLLFIITILYLKNFS